MEYTNKNRLKQNPNPRFLQILVQNGIEGSGLVVNKTPHGWQHYDQYLIEWHANWSVFTLFWPAIAFYALIGKE